MAAQTVFGQPASPATLISDTSDYTMGMQFRLSQSAPLTGIWFYSPPSAGGLPGSCCIYQVTGTGTGTQVAGTVKAPATWSGAAGSGWVKCTYDGSVSLAASTNYKVCIWFGGGANFYGATGHYWDTGTGSAGITSGIITAPNNAGADGGQDTYHNPATGLVYPASSFNANNYWIDVEVTPAAAGPPKANAFAAIFA